MSTWDSGTFDNDYALDWVQDLLETKSLELIETTLDNVIDCGETGLPAPFAAEALAALDVLARLQGRRGDDADEDEIDAWVARCKRKAGAALADKARQALVLIVSAQSELEQSWRRSDSYDAWRAGVDALAARLRPPASAQF